MMKYIIFYLSIFMTMLSCLITYKIVTKERAYLTRKLIVTFFIFSIISFVIRFLNLVYLNLITNAISIFLLQKMCYNISIKKSMYYAIIIMVVSLLLDALMATIISSNYLKNSIAFQMNFYVRAFLCMPVSILLIFVFLIPFIRKIANVFYEKYIIRIKFNRSTILYILLIVNLLCIAFALNIYNEVNRYGHSLILLGIFSFILLFIFMFYLLYREYQIKILNNNIIEENKFIKNIAKQDEEFKHNIINNLLGLKTISNKKTNILIDDLINSYQKEYKNIININDLPNGIQSIIYRKAYEENIENLNLIVNNNIKSELYDILTPRQYNNLCTVIGILFDNALDAIKTEKEKVVEIIFKETNFSVVVIIKNTFSNIIDLDEIGKRNFTTKKNGHGIGVNYIRKLKTINMKNEIINNMFITKLEIKK